MLNFIYTMQAYLAEQGTNINTIVSLFFGLIAFMLAGYLIESELKKSNKGNKGESSNG